jgi:quercetin dioxygenase-like cupin family protein
MKSELPFEDFINPDEVREIVSSKNYRDGEWDRLTRLRGFPAGVEKRVLPVDLQNFRILVLTTAERGTNVASHSHDEAILRYVVSGSLAINGITYGAGEWILIPRDQVYSVETEEGYTTIAGYGVACDNGDD